MLTKLKLEEILNYCDNGSTNINGTSITLWLTQSGMYSAKLEKGKGLKYISDYGVYSFLRQINDWLKQI